MKKYTYDEFNAEVAKRSGWTNEEINNYLWEKHKARDPTFSEEEVELFVDRLRSEK